VLGEVAVDVPADLRAGLIGVQRGGELGGRGKGESK
jgi:hypothetical protein